ncbi:hypothetical protein [Streptomyces zaomyceticus]|uniref:hypothetical protein n=1 Tax=Streptomyces zaomyceticus TaxID=68286 RepID=UPI00379B78DE
MQTGEDIPYAVIAMIVVQALSHLVAAGVLTVSWPLIVLVSAIAPLVLWRMHVLNGKVSNPGVGVYTPQVLTSAQVDSHPVQVDTPEEPPASPKGVPVQVDAHRSEVNTPGEQQVFTPETERLSSERAREVIEQCFQEGLSTRAAAVRATRAPSFVAKVFKELKAA